MQTAIALLRAEALKLPGTRLLWLVLGIPGITLALHLALIFDLGTPAVIDPPAVWGRMLWIGWTFWLAFTLPLFIVLASAALLNLEHRGNHWKQLFAWPIPRWGVYAGKIVFGWLFVAAAFAVFALGMIGDVLLLSGSRGYGIQSEIPWSEVLSAAARATVAAAPAVAIQTWISARFKGFAAPLGIGVGAVVVGLMLMSLRQQKLTAFYPWTLPLATMPEVGAAVSETSALLGLIAGIAIAVIVCWDLARRKDIE